MFESITDLELDEVFEGPFQLPTSIENDYCSTSTKKGRFDFSHFAQTVNLPTNTVLKTNPVDIIEVVNNCRSPKNETKKMVLRKFPGPAGLLPYFTNVSPSSIRTKGVVSENVCSQTALNVFKEGPWHQMSEDFKPQRQDHLFLPDKYNIAWIENKIKTNQLINQKTPFLAAVIEKVEQEKSKNPLVTMVLKDKTGFICGTIIHDLYKENIEVLKQGSVIILKQCGVLTANQKSNLLTITANNLVKIYSEELNNEDRTKIKITLIQNLKADDIMKNIEETKLRFKLLQNGSVSCVTNTAKANSLSVLRQFSNSPNRTDLKINKFVQNNAISLQKYCSPFQSNEGQSENLSHNKKNEVNKCISVSSSNNNLEHNAILQNIFEGIDTDLLFEDF